MSVAYETNVEEKEQEIEPRTASDSMVAVALFAKLDPIALAVGVGVASAIVVMAATLALLIEGAPPGEIVGYNLATIASYLPGFNVSVLGSLGGAFYGFLFGGLAGLFIAGLWNFTHIVVAGITMLRSDWLD